MTRIHGLCCAGHNRMEDGAHFGHLSYRLAPQLWTGDICPPPCFRVCLERYSSVVSALTILQGILNSIICKLVSVRQSLCPPPTTFSFSSKALMAFSGGGGGGGGGHLNTVPVVQIRMISHKKKKKRKIIKNSEMS